MATNELKARVHLDVSGAERKLDALIKKIQKVNAAVKGTGSGATLDAKVAKVAQTATTAETNIKKMAEATKQVAQRTDQVYLNSLKIAQAKAIEEQRSRDELAAIKQRLSAEDRAAKAKIKAAELAEQAAERQRKKEQQIANEKSKAAAKEQRIANQQQREQERLTRRRAAAEESAAKKAEKAWLETFQKQKNAVKSLTKTIAGTIGGILGVQGASSAFDYITNTSDIITGAENKLNYVNGGDKAATEDSMDKMYAAAQRSHTGYADMMSNVGKSMALAGDKAFDGNIDNAIRFQEIMAKAYAIGGASAAEQSSSMYQMVQALGSGILQGDELRSVREGAPLAYMEIEKFAQGLLNTEESLKDLASEGKITSDIVVAAMLNAGAGIDKAFENTDMTVAQAFTNVKNSAVNAMRSVQNTINKFVNSEIGQKLINGISTAISIIVGLVNGLLKALIAVTNGIVNNWNWVKYIFIAGAILISVYLSVLIKKLILVGYHALAAGLKAMAGFIAANWPILLIISLIVILISVLSYLGVSFEEVCGFIVGVIMSAVAFIWNVIVGVINAVMQAFWSIFVEPIAGIIEWFVNAFTGGFDNIGAAFLNLVGQMLSILIGFAKPVASIIDAIFGTNVKDALSKAQQSVKSWGKTETAATYTVNAPQLDRASYSDAYNTGYEWGYSGGEALKSKFDNIKNKLSGANAADEALNTSGYDPAELAKGVGNIDDNTGSIKDSMDMNDEDLEFLRKLAEMEWKKEFTTATITVDMKNNNTINNQGDLDGWLGVLSEKLTEELSMVADGVYA